MRPTPACMQVRSGLLWALVPAASIAYDFTLPSHKGGDRQCVLSFPAVVGVWRSVLHVRNRMPSCIPTSGCRSLVNHRYFVTRLPVNRRPISTSISMSVSSNYRSALQRWPSQPPCCIRPRARRWASILPMSNICSFALLAWELKGNGQRTLAEYVPACMRGKRASGRGCVQPHTSASYSA